MCRLPRSAYCAVQLRTGPEPFYFRNCLRPQAPGPLNMASGELEVQLGKKVKLVPYIVDAPEHQTGCTLAVCLLHGASGTHSTGRLPALAEACVAAGLPCLRFTCRGGQLQHRIDVCKVSRGTAAWRSQYCVACERSANLVAFQNDLAECNSWFHKEATTGGAGALGCMGLGSFLCYY